jgi:Protein of unknown function (DUF1018)
MGAMISNAQKAILHVAKAKLAVPDDQYRTILVQVAGVTSSTELDQAGFEGVMGFFEYLGFKPLVAQGQNFGARAGMASFAQLELIRTLWAEWTHGGDEEALCKWLLRTFKISSLRFMTAAMAPKAITALKAMKRRSA